MDLRESQGKEGFSQVKNERVNEVKNLSNTSFRFFFFYLLFLFLNEIIARTRKNTLKR